MSRITKLKQMRNKTLILLTFFCVFFGQTVNAQNERDSLQNKDTIFVHHDKWSKLINAIAYMESKGHSNVKHGMSVGILQITPLLVKQCNIILKKKNKSKRYNLQDRLSVKHSISMFNLIQDFYNPSHNIRRAIIIWSKGPFHKGSGSKKYINGVMKRLKNR